MNLDEKWSNILIPKLFLKCENHLFSLGLWKKSGMFLFIGPSKIQGTRSRGLILPIIDNHYSLSWSKYATVILVPYLDTLHSWKDSMNIISSFDLVFDILVETSPGNSFPCWFPNNNTSRTTIYDWEVSYGQTVKIPQTTYNVYHKFI